MWPASFWEKVYEPMIRRAAGLGRGAGVADPDHYDKAYAFCDVLVIGGGPAGLAAALAASRSGARVILCDEDFRLGGRLLAERYEIDNKAALDWVKAAVIELESLPDCRILRRTTVQGVYDGGTYAAIERANADGVAMRAQVCGRPIGLVLGLPLTMNPFSTHPSHREIATRSAEERLARLRDPAFRARLLAEEPASSNPFARSVLANFEKMFPLGDPPDYEPAPEQSIAAIAAREGRSPREVAYDVMMERGGKGLIYLPLIGYANGSLEPIREMMLHPQAVFGLSDGGAHCGLICDASMPTFLLTHWVRDRKRGERIPLERVV